MCVCVCVVVCAFYSFGVGSVGLLSQQKKKINLKKMLVLK